MQVHGLVSTHSPQAETSTHIDSVSASYRGAAASLIDKSFDQSEVYGGFCRRAKPPADAGAWLWQQPSTLHKQRRASALSRPPPRTMEQPEACSISWKFMAASVAKAKPPSCRCRCMVLVASKHSPQAETSNRLESTATSHRGAAGSLLDQSELHGGLHRTMANTCRWLVAAASTLHASARSRDEHGL